MNFQHNGKIYELILLNVTGSRMYGNSNENSDWDYRGIFIDRIDNKLSLLEEPVKKIGGAAFDGDVLCKTLQYIGLDIKDTNDIELYEISRFMELALSNNPNIMDLLFANKQSLVYLNEIGSLLKENRDLFLSKDLKETFSNYALSQLKKMNSHTKWINEFPFTHILLENLEILYKKEKIDFDWISDNFGGKVAAKITKENAQDKIKLRNTISWSDFEKELLLNNNSFDPNKYRLPQLIDYCYPKKIQTESLDINIKVKTILNNYESDVTLKEFLQTSASFRIFSPSMISVFTGGKGIFTKEGNLNTNTPKDIGEFVCFLSIDQINFKSNRDYVNKMWEWKCNRNETRGLMEDKFGYDLKHASHLIRLLFACKNILTNNEYLPELSGTSLIINKDIRDGKYSYNNIIDLANNLKKDIDLLFEKSTLPDFPNKYKVNDILMKCYSKSNLFEMNKLEFDFN